ncbi:MAG: lipoate--protein ligase family protein [Planctomycetota bacterium]|jgi:lipoate-protein ligase A|nr:lipoate--protein ligase family protein [Planctomycetota bacterium]
MPESDAALPELPPARALAWSEWALDHDLSPSPAIALWRPEGVHVALGLAQSVEKEVRLGANGGLNAGLVRRQSGGGAVLLYPGVLCWEAIAGLDFVKRAGGGDGIRAAYRALCGPVIAGLGRLGVSAFFAGVSDLAVDGAAEEGNRRKVAGTAQLRRRGRALVHGALLAEADVSAMSEYLLPPSAAPEYRDGRSHRGFCVSLKELLGRGDAHPGAVLRETAAAIAEAAREAGWRVLPPPSALAPPAADLERNKYLSPAWNWRRERRRTEKKSTTTESRR